jgi:hypothetical protein
MREIGGASHVAKNALSLSSSYHSAGPVMYLHPSGKVIVLGTSQYGHVTVCETSGESCCVTTVTLNFRWQFMQ